MLSIRFNQTMPKPLLQLLTITSRSHKVVSEKPVIENAGVEKTVSQDSKLQRYQYGTRSYRLNHIAPERIEHIIQQVQNEHYHVEYLSVFAWGDSQPVEVMAAVTRWAGRCGLKVSINHERGICFFEKDGPS